MKALCCNAFQFSQLFYYCCSSRKTYWQNIESFYLTNTGCVKWKIDKGKDILKISKITKWKNEKILTLIQTRRKLIKSNTFGDITELTTIGKEIGTKKIGFVGRNLVRSYHKRSESKCLILYIYIGRFHTNIGIKIIESNR